MLGEAADVHSLTSELELDGLKNLGFCCAVVPQLILIREDLRSSTEVPRVCRCLQLKRCNETNFPTGWLIQAWVKFLWHLINIVMKICYLRTCRLKLISSIFFMQQIVGFTVKVKINMKGWICSNGFLLCFVIWNADYLKIHGSLVLTFLHFQLSVLSALIVFWVFIPVHSFIREWSLIKSGMECIPSIQCYLFI